ncbi:MAG TPA: Gmad2 immunoglobulin-like domain-containing protein [Actinomycetota bacterium]|nr:Gmad2 immunoglobulin-like domain-containing protein [Actinomycetota bacterium]
MKTSLRFILLAAMLLAAACADAEPVTSSRGAPPSAGESASPEPSPTDEPEEPSPTGTRSLEAWFNYGDHLFVTEREVPATPAVGRAAMEQLIDRPSEFEANAGVTTALPPEVELLDLTIEDGVATVDLSEGFGQGSGSAAEFLQVAQVVYTLTQFDTVTGVLFEVEGERLKMTPGHGILLSGPQTRRDWRDFLPPILVTEPHMGARVSSPVTVAGSANVFEATVSMRIIDAEGNRLARSFTTATCGSGCRGTFEHELAFEVDREQHGVIEVWQASAEDGSRMDLVQIAVTLVP